MAQVIVDEVDQSYAGQEFGAWWSAISAGLNKNTYHRVTLIGDFTMSTPADFTSFRGGFDVNAILAKFTWNGGNAGCMFELTDSVGSTWFGLKLTNDASHRPDNALQLGRTAVPPGGAGAYRSAGKHTFFGLNIAGWWNNAGVYNVSGETCAFMGARVENLYTSGRYAVYHGDQQRAGDIVTSGFGVPPNSNGSVSSSGTVWGQSRIQHEGTEACLYNYGFDRLVFTDCYVQASGDADAQVILDTFPKSILQFKMERAYFHGSTSTAPDWTVIVRGKKNAAVQGTVIDARQDGTSGNGGFFKVEDNADPQLVVQDLNGLELRGMVGQQVLFHATSCVYNALIDTRQDIDTPIITLGNIFRGDIYVQDLDQVVYDPADDIIARIHTAEGDVFTGQIESSLTGIVGGAQAAIVVDGISLLASGADFGAQVNAVLADLDPAEYHSLKLQGSHSAATQIVFDSFTGGLDIDAFGLRLTYTGLGEPMDFVDMEDVTMIGGRFRRTGEDFDRKLTFAAAQPPAVLRIRRRETFTITEPLE